LPDGTGNKDLNIRQVAQMTGLSVEQLHRLTKYLASREIGDESAKAGE